MPRQAKRKATVIQVPDLEQDAAERKRVLNVLAQRRYRERKREHLKNLESQLESSSSPSSARTVAREDASKERQQQQHSFDDNAIQNAIAAQDVPGEDVDISFNGSGWMPEPFPWPAQTLLPSLPASPIGTSSSDTSTSGQATEFNTSPTSLDSSDWPPMEDMDLTSALQTTSTKSYTFPDERHTTILELKLLRSCMTIAKRMNIEDLLWYPDSKSPFTDPALAGLSFDHLPVNLRPTKTQQLIPHHPLFDILAWPTVRDKLIAVFSQEPELRPPCAATPTAFFDLVYDIEDSAEGLRIWGEDPCVDGNWEVGEAVFKKWWWVLDSDIIKKSNEWRMERGAPLLGAGKGFVVGEV
jgi:Domain of unknown function (DUF3425)